MEGLKKCAIGLTLPAGGYRDEDRWDQIPDAMIDNMVRLDHALRQRVQALRSG
jgi:hypothetical protein